MVRKTRLLFLLPLIVLIWTPLYARNSPKLGPLPFTIWFQFAMVAVGALLTALVYRFERRKFADEAAVELVTAGPSDSEAQSA